MASQTPPKPRFFRSPKEFRTWLERNHARAAELWIGYHKKASDKKGMTYKEALDEALCYGWIDGKVRAIDDVTYMQRWTPRTARSPWSKINVRRFGELREAGRAAPAGIAAFERREPTASGYSYEEAERGLDPEYEKTFRRNKRAWAFFEAMAPGQRKVATYWVMSAKKEETRQRRLAQLIELAAEGRKIPLLG
jgi:uncharacterized protein YdeI (YjbR/CyaY-like superfamily)